MRPLFGRRVVEATPQQIMMAGGSVTAIGVDPIDQERGYRSASSTGRREVPYWTREKARDSSVTVYRMNPMARAIIDTYVSFIAGDKGIKPVCTNDDVRKVVDEFWNDPANCLGDKQEVLIRTWLLLGELPLELMVGRTSGVVRYSPMEPMLIKDVTVRAGNPMWPDKLILPPRGDASEDTVFQIVYANPHTDLREGTAMYWALRDIATDVRGMPFLTPILDQLDNYDMVQSNLIDRTAIARYAAAQVIFKGEKANQTTIDQWAAARGGTHLPPSGSMELTTEAIEIKPLDISSKADEDTTTLGQILTSVAAGAGLAKTWLADPEGANRATSMTMAEPVRRRVGGIQQVWLAQMTELCRFAVDQAVAKRRLPAEVESINPRTAEKMSIPASQSVMVQGPEIAAADAQFNAQVMLNLATALEKFQQMGFPKPASDLAMQKAWEDLMGVPWRPELGTPEASRQEQEQQQAQVAERRLQLAPPA